MDIEDTREAFKLLNFMEAFVEFLCHLKIFCYNGMKWERPIACCVDTKNKLFCTFFCQCPITILLWKNSQRPLRLNKLNFQTVS